MEDSKSDKEILTTGSPLHNLSHKIARDLMAISLFVVVPLIVFALGNFADVRKLLIALGILFFIGGIYYIFIPTKYIPRIGYILMDYFFYVMLTVAFSHLRPLVGIPILFFYLVLFVIIDAVSYNWRDLIFILIGASFSATVYNWLFVAEFSQWYERIGFSLIEIIILWILGIEMRILAEMALHEEKRVTRLEEEVSRLQELDRLKTEFLDVASHQLNTPLSEIRWALSSISAGLAGEDAKLLEVAKSASNRLGALLKGFLQVTSVEGGEYFRPESIDIASLLSEIVADLTSLAREKSVTLHYKPVAPTVISGDRFLLKGAFSNLVDNAVRYSHPGGEVVIAVEEEPKGVSLSIQDTGIGMNPEEREKLFTKFYRGARASHLHTDGSGLGAYYARAVILRHDGSLEIKSELEQGTTIIVRLPRTEKKYLVLKR